MAEYAPLGYISMLDARARTERWLHDHPEVGGADEAEFPSRAYNLVRGMLAQNWLPSIIVDQVTGRRWPIPSHHWAADERNHVGMPPSYVGSWPTYRVWIDELRSYVYGSPYVRTDDLDAALRGDKPSVPSGHGAPPDIIEHAPANISPKPTNKGGRPNNPDNDAFFMEMARLERSGEQGPPKTQEQFIIAMDAWANTKGNMKKPYEPDTIEAKVKAFWRRVIKG